MHILLCICCWLRGDEAPLDTMGAMCTCRFVLGLSEFEDFIHISLFPCVFVQYVLPLGGRHSAICIDGALYSIHTRKYININVTIILMLHILHFQVSYHYPIGVYTYNSPSPSPSPSPSTLPLPLPYSTWTLIFFALFIS